MKRLFLFLITNLLVLATISIILNVFNIAPYLSQYGINYESLMIFCILWGMGGAFISLLISKKIAKWTTGVKVIHPVNSSGRNASLVKMVHDLARKAKLPAMPEVGIYGSNEVNAFATGPSKRNSLVAVSEGLLNSMDENELEGVLAHEVSHIANGDMITMTLIQGVVNSFAMFLSRIISYAITSSMREESAYMVRFLLTIVFDILFSILGSIVVAAFSRWREYRADAGGAYLSGKHKMIAALKNLSTKINRIEEGNSSITSLKISNKKGLIALFSTHPPLADRINRLEK